MTRPYAITASLGAVAVCACGLGELVKPPPDLVRLDCLVTQLQPDTSVSGTLDDESCTAPRASERWANLYRVSAHQGDSLSITVAASGLAPRLLVVESSDFQSLPAVETAECGRLAGAACVRHFVVTRDEPLGLLVSSAQSGETGPYTLTVTRPRDPRSPADLNQLAADERTPIPAGGELGASAVVLSAAVSDPDTLEFLRLEVEIRPLSDPFTGEATASSTPAATRSPTVGITGLASGTSYHWQARAVDETGRATAWIPFGGNSESLPDFRTAASVEALAFRVQPRTTPAGQGMTPSVEVVALDASGNVVTSFTGSVTLSLQSEPGSGAGIQGGNPSVNAENGVAVFSGLTIERAGAGYRLDAFTAGGPSATSERFDIVPGPAVRLAYTVQPSHTAAGRIITPPVQVTAFDAFDNVATGFAGTVTVSLGRDPSLGLARLSGNDPVDAVNGVAIFSELSVDTPGQGYTLRASALMGSLESAAFNVSIF